MHNKTKHSKAVCILLGLYYISRVHTQTTKTLGSTSIRHRSDAKASDGCLIDVDPEVFSIWIVVVSLESKTTSKNKCEMNAFINTFWATYYEHLKPLSTHSINRVRSWTMVCTTFLFILLRNVKMWRKDVNKYTIFREKDDEAAAFVLKPWVLSSGEAPSSVRIKSSLLRCRAGEIRGWPRHYRRCECDWRASAWSGNRSVCRGGWGIVGVAGMHIYNR